MLPYPDCWNHLIRDRYRTETADLPLEEKIVAILNSQRAMGREDLIVILAYNGISRDDVVKAIHRLNKQNRISYDALHQLACRTPY